MPNWLDKVLGFLINLCIFLFICWFSIVFLISKGVVGAVLGIIIIIGYLANWVTGSDGEKELRAIAKEHARRERIKR